MITTEDGAHQKSKTEKEARRMGFEQRSVTISTQAVNRDSNADLGVPAAQRLASGLRFRQRGAMLLGL
jgi:hypothetical protein